MKRKLVLVRYTTCSKNYNDVHVQLNSVLVVLELVLVVPHDNLLMTFTCAILS